MSSDHTTRIDNIGFMVPVIYSIPDMSELIRRFPGGVSSGFRRATYVSTKACEAVPRVSGELRLEYVCFGRDIWNGEALHEIKARDCRPALPEELLSHAMHQPDEQLKFNIVALGAVAYDSIGQENFVYLSHVGRRPSLNMDWHKRGLGSRDRLLVVRLKSSDICKN